MFSQQVIDNSVRKGEIETAEGQQNLVIFFAETNTGMTPWNGNPTKRDRELAAFWKTEPFLASAITSIAMTRAALSWELAGTPRTVKQVQNILNSANNGQGWQNLMMLVNIDLLTLDNGAFIEIIRKPPTAGRKPESMPVIGLGHLPGINCVRTGNPKQPVIYIDATGVEHPLEWYQVVTLTENPIPESLTGRQLCFVSRVLKYAQGMVSLETYKNEKISGRFNKAIHVISGVAQAEVNAIERKSQIDAENMGLTRYMQPVILTTLDPNARISKETIELASLPENFDDEQNLTQYITLLALASGSDFQEFAPLSGGNLGTASQSDTLHRKSQRKGTQLFIKTIENGLTQSRVIPPSIGFQFKQQDAQAELEQVEIDKIKAETRKIQIEDGEITAEIARQMAVDSGGLKQEYLVMMGETDQTPSVTVGDDETVAEELLQLDKDKTTSTPYFVRRAMALWVKRLITENKVQNVHPIPANQLNVFTDALTKLAQKYYVFSTSIGWLNYPLIAAAKDAGIDPVALRRRLPDSYIVQNVANNVVIKENGKLQIVYRYQPVKEKTVTHITRPLTHQCYTCNQPGIKTSYIAGYNNWVTTCNTHAAGLIDDLSPVAPSNLNSIITLLEKGWANCKSQENKVKLVVSALAWLHKVRTGNYPDEEVIRDYISNINTLLNVDNITLIKQKVIEIHLQLLTS